MHAADDVRGAMIDDVFDLFIGSGADALTPAEIAGHLAGLDDRPWPWWNQGEPIVADDIRQVMASAGIRLYSGVYHFRPFCTGRTWYHRAGA